MVEEEMTPERDSMNLQGLLNLARMLRAKRSTAKVYADYGTIEGFRLWLK